MFLLSHGALVVATACQGYSSPCCPSVPVPQMDVPIPLRRAKVRVGDPAELLVLSDSPSLSRFRAVREVFLPGRELWLVAPGEACVERAVFEELRRRVVLPAWMENPEVRRTDSPFYFSCLLLKCCLWRLFAPVTREGFKGVVKET